MSATTAARSWGSGDLELDLDLDLSIISGVCDATCLQIRRVRVGGISPRGRLRLRLPVAVIVPPGRPAPPPRTPAAATAPALASATDETSLPGNTEKVIDLMSKLADLDLDMDMDLDLSLAQISRITPPTGACA